jgi:hypothetical protein
MKSKSKEYYIALFADYPDLVTVLQFREMLGGVSDSFVRNLITGNKVRHFKVKPYFYIPKCSIIEYVLSDDYAHRNLKVKI